MTDTARFLWMAEILEVKADDRLLEIGCGVGHAVALLAPRLESGFITAIDRSKSMMAKALIRNDRFVRSRKAEFIVADLAAFSGTHHGYNKIFAFNVNLFWVQKKINNEIEIIRHCLAEKGHLYLFYQPPSEGRSEEITDIVSDNLSAHGFDVTETVYDRTVKSCCIVSRRK